VPSVTAPPTCQNTRDAIPPPAITTRAELLTVRPCAIWKIQTDDDETPERYTFVAMSTPVLHL
jgi:hypothetical protein